MTLLTQQKDVRFQADERLDLNDLTAITALKAANLKEMMIALFEPPANGRVLYGFNCGASSDPMDVEVYASPATGPGSAGGSIAIDAAGGVLEQTVGVDVIVTLPPNKTNYIHAYLIPTDSDSANRRFINNGVSPSVEYTAAMYTRTTDAVGFYVLSNSDAVPDLGSFELTTVIGGVTVNLVAVAATITGGASIGAITDFRTMFMVNENPESGSGITLQEEVDGALATVSTDRDFDVRGIRSMFLRIADVLNGITGGYYASGGTYAHARWWDAPTSLKEVVDARADAATAVVQTSLAKHVDAVKSAHITIGAAGVSDFRTLTAALAVFTGAQSHSIHVKDGTVTEPAAVTFTSWNLHLSGNGPGVSTIAAKAQLLFSAADTATIKDLTFATDGVAAIDTPFKFAATATQLLVDNCVFNGRLGNGSTNAVMEVSGSAAGAVKFRNCTFIWTSTAPLFNSLLRGYTEPVIFENCQFYPMHIGCTVFGTSTSLIGVQFNGCYFGTKTRTFGGLGGITAGAVGSTVFKDCTFMNTGTLFTFFTDAVIDVIFDGCHLLRNAVSSAPSYLLTWNSASTPSSGSRVRIINCDWSHDYGFYKHPMLSPEKVRLTVQGSTFQLYAPAATLNLFDFAGGYPGGDVSFSGCRFYYAGLTVGAVIHYHPTQNSIVPAYFDISDCVFSASGGDGTDDSATSVAYYAISLNCAHLNQIQQHLWVTGCRFIKNTHVTQLPLQIATAAFATGVDCYLTYFWQNGANGSIAAESGCELGSYSVDCRIVDTASRGFLCV